MPESTAAALISDRRQAKGWSRKQLADATGYSAVMIAKIESGERTPDATRIPKIAAELGIDADELAAAVARSDKRTSGAPKIVDAMKLAKQNSRRADILRARAEKLRQSAETTAADLDAKVQEFISTVVGPTTEVLARVTGLPEDAIVRTDLAPHDVHPTLAETLKSAQWNTSKTIFSMIGSGILGAGGGAAFGAGAATATYMMMASVAAASTGVAISELSGAAAKSATLAAIGGGSRAAGGLGVAGGTAVLMGIVAFPIFSAGVGAVIANGGRLLEKQREVEKEIDEAEKDFEVNREIVDTFVRRATQITEILMVALVASRRHRAAIADAVPDDDTIAWDDLDDATRTSVRRLAEIILACLTALMLPIGMALAQAAPEDDLAADVKGESAMPKMKPELDVLPELESEYIDYVIGEALAQVAN